MLSCPSSTSVPLFALALPCILVAVAYAHLGMVSIDLLLLLLHDPFPPRQGTQRVAHSTMSEAVEGPRC
jgi:hypothetical protein